MKIGDYVRNKYGIAKVVDIENKNDINILKFDRDIAFMIDTKENKELYRTNYLPLTEYIDINKINFSPNIIDLIENSDLVVDNYGNIYVVHCIYDDDSIANDYNLKHKKCIGTNIYDVDFQEKLIYEEEIKSIVTKEQFEAMQYKVGDE